MNPPRVVVTGAAGGLGRAVATELARRGARLSLVGRRPEPLAELASSLPGEGHLAYALDVTRDDLWPAAVVKLCPEGPAAGLVTAAAVIGPVGPIGSWDVAAFRQAVDVNLVGTLLAVASLRPRLADGGGSVVTFSGGGATAPLPRYDAYAVSKAAVVRLTENLAADLGTDGIRINAVAPGFVVTGIHQATLDAGPHRAGSEYFERTSRAVASGHADPPGPAAELVAFLLSEEAAGITGRLISARWDVWRDPALLDRLRRDPDLGTLRRVDDQLYTAVRTDQPGGGS